MHIVGGMESISRAQAALPPVPSPRWPVAPARTTTSTGTRRLWAILIVLCGALFLDGLDVSMVGVALPDIRTALGLSTSSLQWVVSGYVLGYGGLLLLGGRAADLLGRRRVFLAALAVFAVASLFGGLVSSPEPADRGPVRQGHRGRLHRPGRAVAAHHHVPRGPDAQPGHQRLLRVRGQRILARPGAVRPAHRGELAADAAGAGAGGADHPHRRDPVHPARAPHGRPASGRRFDIPGAVTVTGAMLLLVYTVVSAQQAGWGSARTIGSFAAVVVALAAFVAIERRSADPLVPLGIFRSGRADQGEHRRDDAVRLLRLVPVPGHPVPADAWRAGRAVAPRSPFLPAGVVVAVLSTRMSAIIGRFGPARVTVVAFISLVAGYAVFLRVGVQPRLPVGDPARRDADRGRVRPGLLRAQPGRDRGRPDASRASRPACSRPRSRSAGPSCSPS